MLKLCKIRHQMARTQEAFPFLQSAKLSAVLGNRGTMTWIATRRNEFATVELSYQRHRVVKSQLEFHYELREAR